MIENVNGHSRLLYLSLVSPWSLESLSSAIILYLGLGVVAISTGSHAPNLGRKPLESLPHDSIPTLYTAMCLYCTISLTVAGVPIVLANSNEIVQFGSNGGTTVPILPFDFSTYYIGLDYDYW